MKSYVLVMLNRVKMPVSRIGFFAVLIMSTKDKSQEIGNKS